MPDPDGGAPPGDLHATERVALLLFDDLLDIPETSRGRWIEERTADPAVKARLAELLEADRIASLRTGGAALGLSGPAPLPERIGQYRITALIGRGGMGAVYRGVRDAGDFSHEAAIKLIKPGLLSDVLAQRFRTERQTLATLQHPNIARLYDGGETPDGSPYIVMELIEGEPIDRWADSHGLDTAARVQLVETAARAVAHAHQRLVVHRDITPLNVLVQPDGVLKLIDFGIARPANSEGAATATDIAGLGRLIARLVPHPPPELAAIIQRATSPEPPRYEAAQALADDLAAFRTGNPVSAMGGGERYRLRKFVQRNRPAVAASALAVLALVAGLVFAGLSWQRAEAARAAEAARFAQLRSLANYLIFDLNDRLHRIPGNTAARAHLAGEAQRYLGSLAATPDASADVRLETVRGLVRLAQIQASPTERNLGEEALARANLARASALLTSLEAEEIAAAIPERARLTALQSLLAIHRDRKGDEALKLLQSAEAHIETVPVAERDRGWHLARRDIGRAALELYSTDNRLDDLAREAAAHAGRAATWPAPLAASLDARIEQAHSLYFQGLVPYLKAEGPQGVDTLLAALAAFRAAERERPDDPDLLYMIGWAGLDSYAAAQSTGRYAESETALEAGAAAVERLTALDSADRSAARLYRNLGETRAQHLSNSGRPAEAIAAQRAVIARTEAGVANETEAHSRADLAFNHMILGLIAKKAGNRELTCESWQQARTHFTAVEASGELVGFHKSFLPGLDANLARCRAGDPLSTFKPLK